MPKTEFTSFNYKITKNESVDEWRELWGIPNWESYAAYPKSLNKAQVKWEFVRRDSNYRLMWEYYQEELEKHSTLTEEEFERDIFDPITTSSEYDLAEFINPNTQAKNLRGKIFFLEYRGTKITHYRDGSLWVGNFGSHAKNMISNGKALFVFDVSRPLPSQITKATSVLKRAQKEFENKANIHIPKRDGITKDYIQHLRLLDAVSERVPYSTIGQKIFGTRDSKDAGDRARKEFKRAIHMWRYI